MFYHIRGTYVHREENFAVIDCGGIGYRLTVSQNTADALGMPEDTGKTVKLYTYLAVREDAIELFGFYTQEELDCFRLLIAVSGVGPKAAMAILSILTPEKLAMAVRADDVKLIARANGVGAKTAARVVLELQDKFSGFSFSTVKNDAAPAVASNAVAASGHTVKNEALEALSVLGYSRSEILDALDHTDAKTVEEIITDALKYFSKRG